MRAHCTVEDLHAGRISCANFYGNSVADALASAGAAANADSTDRIREVVRIQEQAQLIFCRLVAANLQATKLLETINEGRAARLVARLNRCKAKSSDVHKLVAPSCLKRLPRSLLIHEMCKLGHSVQITGRRARCVLCGLFGVKAELCQVVRSRKQCVAPLPGRKAMGSSTVPQVELPVAYALKNTFDCSHKLAFHRGVWWCWSCGSYTTGTPSGLRKPCRKGTSQRGACVLKKLRQGLPPIAHMQWPLGPCFVSSPDGLSAGPCFGELV